MKRRFFLLVLTIVICFTFLLGCSKTARATEEGDFFIVREINLDKSPDVIIIADKVTGVEYIIYRSGYGKGLCPRYNEDGSLFNVKQE